MHLPGMVLEAVICITDVRTCLGYASDYVCRPITADLVRDLDASVSCIEASKREVYGTHTGAPKYPKQSANTPERLGND